MRRTEFEERARRGFVVISIVAILAALACARLLGVGVIETAIVVATGGLALCLAYRIGLWIGRRLFRFEGE